MSRDVREGRLLQLKGRLKMGWARLTGDDALATKANADVVAGTLQESFGHAVKQTTREVTRGIDALADVAKRAARSLDR